VSTDLSWLELATIQTLLEPPLQEDADWEMADDVLSDILNGNQPINISHEGGEFNALLNLENGIHQESVSSQSTCHFYFNIYCSQTKSHRAKYWTHHDREDNRNKDFAKQIDAFTTAYMEWDLCCVNGSTPTPEQDASGTYTVHVVDVFSESRRIHIA
jgi:hypothetical protein